MTQMKIIAPIILILSIGVISIYIMNAWGKSNLRGIPLPQDYEISEYKKSSSYFFGDAEYAWHVKVDTQLILPEYFVPADESDLAFAKSSILSLLDLADRDLDGFSAYRIPHSSTSTFYLLTKDDAWDVYIYLFTN